MFFPSRNRCITLLLAFSMCLVCSGLSRSVFASSEDDVRKGLFRDTDEILQAAEEKMADFYAEKSFQKGLKYYKKAEEDLKDGKSIERIKKKLKDAREYFNKSIAIAEKAALVFKDAAAARKDALKVEASKFAPDLWEKAEDKFKYARKYLEESNEDSAKNRAEDAVEIYRDAELFAIKTKYLKDAQDLLEKAKEMNAKKYAPKTMESAGQLVRRASEMLDRNRYETEKVQELTREAMQRALLGIYLYKHIKDMKKQDYAFEDILIESHKPIKEIASQLGIPVQFDKGVNAPKVAIVAAIKKLQQERNHLTDILMRKDADIADLLKQRKQKDTIIQAREDEISGLKLQASELEMRLDKLMSKEEKFKEKARKEKIRKEKFERIKKSFPVDEAEVTSDADKNIIIHLFGLVFPEGTAVIEPHYFGLLARVNDAIAEFPGSEIVIEGHTDSKGDDAKNLQLSNARALAVKEYVIANTGIRRNRIKAVGMGEKRPVASNDTTEGRAKNRRIDVIIKPAG